MNVPANSSEKDEPISSPLSERDIENAAYILERLAVQAGDPAERSRIRRALEESAVADAPDTENWWRWISESARSLGYTCKVVEGTASELLTVARDNAPVLMRTSQGWVSIAEVRRKQCLILRQKDSSRKEWQPTRRLPAMLNLRSKRDVVRGVVLDRHHTTAIERPGGDVPSPLSRLWRLLSPEWPDIWIIVVFALVTGLLALATPLAVETLVSTVAFGRFLQPIVILALVLLVFLSFSAALRAVQTYVVEIIQRRLFARVAADLAYRLPRVEIQAIEKEDGRELVNRFFDIVTVQKVSAQLLLDGIQLVLGTFIGMAVLAFYHPWLLGFDIILLALIAFVILVLGRGAISTSIKESKLKYRMADWLENVVACPTTFRYGGAAEFALDRADRITYEYLKYREAHFNVVMRQIIFALGLQAIASTMLLGLGGWLVISGQLTLGQLVASELIVTVIVGSFAKLGKHMESFYDLLAAVDKLGVLFDLPIEQQDGLIRISEERPSAISVKDGACSALTGNAQFKNATFEVKAGKHIRLVGKSDGVESVMLDVLYGIRELNSGWVAIDGYDPRDIRPDVLRRSVALVRDLEIIPGTVAENVHLERPNVSMHDVREALQQVGLLDAIGNLDKGLDTELTNSGYPLTPLAARRLQLARAIAGRPNLLLIDRVLDAFSDDDARQLMQMLTHFDHAWTLIVVTGRESLNGLFDQVIHLSDASSKSAKESAHA
ncbi:peptidase domain-containing ABC transporter [Rubinisphaera sp. JC750]|uniref:peptidase domain-containing ABC transporter n=1 Tax=Rubinisphaera sp. JC750 TaxID=2898658 RepID=UPI001F1BA642|nr:ABC transporter ATP-binding protein [Rubinisphaera sp. JC750]